MPAFDALAVVLTAIAIAAGYVGGLMWQVKGMPLPRWFLWLRCLLRGHRWSIVTDCWWHEGCALRWCYRCDTTQHHRRNDAAPLPPNDPPTAVPA